MTATIDEQELWQSVVALGCASDDPCCECRHGPDEIPCPAPAAFRVTLLCQVESCDRAAASYLLCGVCKDVWLQRSRRGAVRIRVSRL